MLPAVLESTASFSVSSWGASALAGKDARPPPGWDWPQRGPRGGPGAAGPGALPSRWTGEVQPVHRRPGEGGEPAAVPLSQTGQGPERLEHRGPAHRCWGKGEESGGLWDVTTLALSPGWLLDSKGHICKYAMIKNQLVLGAPRWCFWCCLHSRLLSWSCFNTRTATDTHPSYCCFYYCSSWLPWLSEDQDVCGCAHALRNTLDLFTWEDQTRYWKPQAGGWI